MPFECLGEGHLDRRGERVTGRLYDVIGYVWLDGLRETGWVWALSKNPLVIGGKVSARFSEGVA